MCIHKLTLRQPLVKQPDEAPRIERSPSPGRVSGGHGGFLGRKLQVPRKIITFGILFGRLFTLIGILLLLSFGIFIG